jgi:tetratricopeptide (TPR) repeat protein
MKGLRFRKSINLLPGVRLNISKSGASVSVGPRGAHITSGPRGTFFNLDLPGSGLSYRKKIEPEGGASPKKATSKNGQNQPETPEQLNLGFWQQLTVPDDEKALVEGFKALSEGDEARALENAQTVAHIPDGAFVAGFLLFKRGEFERAMNAFQMALQKPDELGKIAAKYGLDLSVSLPITEDISATIEPNLDSVQLALAECQQQLGLIDAALENLRQLYRLYPEDVLVRLSLAELLSDTYPDDPQVQREIVQLAENAHNESAVHAALMYYRARALRKLGLLDGAMDTLTKALKRKAGYPDDLLLALNYERALIYDLTGEKEKAHAEFEKIYAESPSYEDVAARLGL